MYVQKDMTTFEFDPPMDALKISDNNSSCLRPTSENIKVVEENSPATKKRVDLTKRGQREVLGGDSSGPVASRKNSSLNKDLDPALSAWS